MRALEAEALRSRWGDKPCSHHQLEKEYSRGWPTGDFVCTLCGQSRSGVAEKRTLALVE
jgi:hypothetical protein